MRWGRQRTFVAASGSPLEDIRTHLMETFLPSRTPSHISLELPEAKGWRPALRSEDERVYEVGSIILVPHAVLSSRRHFRKAGLKWSSTPRAYGSLSEERKRKTRRHTSSR